MDDLEVKAVMALLLAEGMKGVIVLARRPTEVAGVGVCLVATDDPSGVIYYVVGLFGLEDEPAVVLLSDAMLGSLLGATRLFPNLTPATEEEWERFVYERTGRAFDAKAVIGRARGERDQLATERLRDQLAEHVN